MKILLCALEAPLPPPNGLNLVVAGTLEALRDGHDVRLVAYRAPTQHGDVDDARLVDRGEVAAWRRSLARGAAMLRRQAWDAAACARGLAPAVAEEASRFGPDVVHVVSGRLARLADGVARCPRVLTAIDAWHLNADAAAATSSGPRRLALSMQARNVRRFEADAYRRFDRVAVITERDRQALLEVAPDLAVAVVPHGVDSTRYAPSTSPAEPVRTTMALHGVMSYAPNVDAATVLARAVLPAVRAEVPSATLALVGRDPADAVRQLGRLPGVSVTGAVEDVRPWLTGASVYVCPMRHGGGMKNKVLEAMAAGTPCVVSRLAIEGIAAEHERHVLVADTPEAVAAAVLRLLRDPSLARSLGTAGRALIRAEHDWAAVGAAYDRLYAEIAAERQAPTPQGRRG